MTAKNNKLGCPVAFLRICSGPSAFLLASSQKPAQFHLKKIKNPGPKDWGVGWGGQMADKRLFERRL